MKPLPTVPFGGESYIAEESEVLMSRYFEAFFNVEISVALFNALCVEPRLNICGEASPFGFLVVVICLLFKGVMSSLL